MGYGGKGIMPINNGEIFPGSTKINYILHDENGCIRRWGKCEEEDLISREEPGLTLLRGAGEFDTHYVLNGDILKYTHEQHRARSEPFKSMRGLWDNTSMSWIDLRSLLELKIDKINELKSHAQMLDVLDITIQNITFKADEETKKELLNEALIAQMAILDNQSYSLDWEKADGSDITLTANQLKGLIRAIRQRSNNIRNIFRSLRTQVMSCTTKEEIDTIAWPT
jgi:hypothetical protein